MKKILLFFIACFVFVSVQAQEKVTVQSLTKDAKVKVAQIDKIKPLTKDQKLILLDYYVNQGKIAAGTFTQDLKANPPKDINMSEHFDLEHLKLIKEQNKTLGKGPVGFQAQKKKKGF